MALVTTVAGLSSNAYITVAEANDLIPALVSSDILTEWTAASTTDQENAIIRATTLLDNLRWDGELATATTESEEIVISEPDSYVWDRDEFRTDVQALQLPRHFMKDDTGALVIPARAKKACALQAAHIINESGEKYQQLAAAGIKKFKIDDGVEVEFDPRLRTSDSSRVVVKEAYDLVKRYLRGPAIEK